MGLEWGVTSLLIRIICNIHSNDEHQGRCSFPSSHSNLFGSSRHPACQDLSWFLSMSRCLQKWVLPLGSWAQEPCQVRTYTFRCLHEQADKKLIKELGVGSLGSGGEYGKQRACAADGPWYIARSCGNERRRSW